MIRSYAVTFAFVTFRIFDNLFISWKIAPEPEVDTAFGGRQANDPEPQPMATVTDVPTGDRV